MFTHNHMVTYKISTFVYLNVDYHHQEHFFGREWMSTNLKYKGKSQGLEILNCLSTKNSYFGRPKHLKKWSKILSNTFSDSLAILKRKICRLTPAYFFDRKISGSLPVPITVSSYGNDYSRSIPILLEGTHTAAANVWMFRTQFCVSETHMEIMIKNVKPDWKCKYSDL